MKLELDKRAITYLPGVGPRKADILKKEAEIVSYEDLLYYFPYKYVDRSRFYTVSEVTGSMPYIQLKGKILFLTRWVKDGVKGLSVSLRTGRGHWIWSGSKA